ncbi:hypothetical protein ISS37_05375 [candidate division KSB1 bacterium]|nr:hypothetical protein [candidate division KSB1 bacterium]
MRYEYINESVDVISLSQGGKMRPLRFRWNQMVYKVSQISGHWVTNEGASRFYHYAVLCGTDDVFELCFDSVGMNWRITRVCLAG